MIPNPPDPPPTRLVCDSKTPSNPIPMPSVGRGQPSMPESPPGGSLTGRKRYRLGRNDKLVLQVEYVSYNYSLPWSIFARRGVEARWRDATVQDISSGELV
jgi:hypothetical protein